MPRPRCAAPLIGFLLVGVLSGCMASQNPVGPLSESLSDPRLVGSWQGEDGDDFIHVLPPAEGGNKSHEIIAVERDGGWLALNGYVTALGEHRVVNLRLLAANAATMAGIEGSGVRDSHPYSFVPYRFDGDDVLLLGRLNDAVYEAVKAGRLTGETHGDYDVYVSDSSEHIAAFLASIDWADVFKEPERYRRLTPPAP